MRGHSDRGGTSFMDINSYLTEIRALAASGQATEHSYRPALERLDLATLETEGLPIGRREAA